MKKPFNNAYAFTALFVFAAITPQSVWASKCKVINGRMPASDEQITCLKEEKDRLEKDMKKLVEDKEKVIKELEELKASKKESPSDKKLVAKEEHDQDMTDMMSYFTYMLLNQQQQQEAMMNQMFSYMTQSMQNFVYNQSMQNVYGQQYGQQYYAGWKNPYSLQNPGESGYQYTSMNPLTRQGLGLGLGFESGIGISYTGESFYQNPYARNQQQDFVKTIYRYPASQPSQMELMPNQLERSQILTPPRVDGYDFNKEVPVQTQQPKPEQEIFRKPPLQA